MLMKVNIKKTYANEEQTLSTSSDEDIDSFANENEALSQEMLAIEQEANAFIQTKPEVDFFNATFNFFRKCS